MQETFKFVLLLFVTFPVVTVFEVGSRVAQDGHESSPPLSSHLHLSTNYIFTKNKTKQKKPNQKKQTKKIAFKLLTAYLESSEPYLQMWSWVLLSLKHISQEQACNSKFIS